MTASPTPAASALAAPTAVDMIHAIRAVQFDQASKIGAACVALTGVGKTKLDMTALLAEVEVLAALDLAMTVLQAGV